MADNQNTNTNSTSWANPTDPKNPISTTPTSDDNSLQELDLAALDWLTPVEDPTNPSATSTSTSSSSSIVSNNNTSDTTISDDIVKTPTTESTDFDMSQLSNSLAQDASSELNDLGNLWDLTSTTDIQDTSNSDSSLTWLDSTTDSLTDETQNTLDNSSDTDLSNISTDIPSEDILSSSDANLTTNSLAWDTTPSVTDSDISVISNDENPLSDISTDSTIGEMPTDMENSSSNIDDISSDFWTSADPASITSTVITPDMIKWDLPNDSVQDISSDLADKQIGENLLVDDQATDKIWWDEFWGLADEIGKTLWTDAGITDSSPSDANEMPTPTTDLADTNLDTNISSLENSNSSDLPTPTDTSLTSLDSLASGIATPNLDSTASSTTTPDINSNLNTNTNMADSTNSTPWATNPNSFDLSSLNADLAKVDSILWTTPESTTTTTSSISTPTETATSVETTTTNNPSSAPLGWISLDSIVLPASAAAWAGTATSISALETKVETTTTPTWTTTTTTTESTNAVAEKKPKWKWAMKMLVALAVLLSLVIAWIFLYFLFGKKWATKTTNTSTTIITTWANLSWQVSSISSESSEQSSEVSSEEISSEVSSDSNEVSSDSNESIRTAPANWPAVETDEWAIINTSDTTSSQQDSSAVSTDTVTAWAFSCDMSADKDVTAKLTTFKKCAMTFYRDNSSTLSAEKLEAVKWTLSDLNKLKADNDAWKIVTDSQINELVDVLNSKLSS